MDSFTPLPALAGGALIGAAAALLMLGSGRIAGISGILGALLSGPRRDAGWRLAFLIGLLAAPVLVTAAGGTAAGRIDTPLPLLIAAGLLVGIGTRMGAGCTSGHGVCGLARLSVRSAVATGLFMAAAAATVFVVRHVIGG